MSDGIFEALGQAKKEAKRKRRNSIQNKIEEHGLDQRFKFVNSGVLLFDNKYYYYIESRNARRKGNNKRYQMKSFDHFVDVFINGNTKKSKENK